MLNEIKRVLIKPYNEQLDEYKEYKSKFDELQDEIIYDSSEKDYEEKIKLLKKSNLTKQEQETKKQEIMTEYKKQLDSFNKKYEEYNIMKSKLAAWNVYDLKSKMEKINEAKNLEEVGLTLEQAKEICHENGIEFRIDLEQM